MTSIMPLSLLSNIAAKPNSRPHPLWSRRDYHERLNLRRIVSRQHMTLPVLEIALEQEEVTRDKN